MFRISILLCGVESTLGAGGSACNQSPPAAAAKKGVRAIAGWNRDNIWAKKDSDLP